MNCGLSFHTACLLLCNDFQESFSMTVVFQSSTIHDICYELNCFELKLIILFNCLIMKKLFFFLYLIKNKEQRCVTTMSVHIYLNHLTGWTHQISGYFLAAVLLLPAPSVYMECLTFQLIIEVDDDVIYLYSTERARKPEGGRQGTIGESESKRVSQGL